MQKKGRFPKNLLTNPKISCRLCVDKTLSLLQFPFEIQNLEKNTKEHYAARFIKEVIFISNNLKERNDTHEEEE